MKRIEPSAVCFTDWKTHRVFHFAGPDPLLKQGLSVVPIPLPQAPFTDETDRKFYEVARFCGAPLVTGNTAHFPKDGTILTVAEFHERYMK